MTNHRAEQVANVLIAGACVGVAVAILKTPALRRLAWRLAVTTATGTVPTWIDREVRHAWSESGQGGL